MSLLVTLAHHSHTYSHKNNIAYNIFFTYTGEVHHVQ